ncbi:MAG: tetratricopeptide repeat protein [Terracidiphilus sp.]
MAHTQHRPAEPSQAEGLLSEAIRCHEAGRFDEARRRYLDVLATSPKQAQSLHGLGLIAQQTGDLESAIRSIRQAVAIDPSDAGYHFSLGSALQAHRQIDEALNEYRQALALNPKLASAHNNIAALLQQQGKLEEARLHYERAVAAKPDYAAAYCNLGALLKNQGDFSGAVVCHRKALAIKPDFAEAHNNLGLALRGQGKIQEAKTHYERAVALRPNYAEAHSNLGVLLRLEGSLEDSLACHQRALSLSPNSAQALDNLGNTLCDLGRLDESAASHRRAVAIRPNFAAAHSNLGHTLRKQGKLPEARQSFNRALALEPQNAEIRWNLALLDLLEGNFAAGWLGYEARHQRNENRPRSFPQPIWRGEPLHGARILLHAEQGLGDSLQFVRYVPMVHAAGGTVILNVPASLRRLAAQLPGVETLTVDDEPLPPFDWHAPLMSLPLAFKTGFESIPNQCPYLTVPEEAMQDAMRAHKDLKLIDQKLHVGLVWCGDLKNTVDRMRSMKLSTLQPLFDLDGVQFFSLQLGPAALQLAAMPAPVQAPLVDLRHAIQDFADTAALMAHLDLIITVDTSVAHLAGALGKPAWVMLPFAPDWRWLMDREDSPWYPAMRLFRQTRSGDWQPVVQRVRGELAALAGRDGFES